MEKLRRSIRQSFRRRSSKDFLEDAAKPHQWQKDEASVRAGTCSFSVKYLGCVEVFESRGMQVCEEALKMLRSNRRRTVKGVLHVSGDGLRVVDAESKGLIVDQTIEKVSFCAPDRNNEKGFAYICRDGTTRRWICHGFHASKDSGERLSHAVGCAFAVCLEQKQKRDREANQIQPTPVLTLDQQKFSPAASQSQTDRSNSVGNAGHRLQMAPAAKNVTQLSFHGSFRRASLAERKEDPQNAIMAERPPVRPTCYPNAVARPAPNKALFERQGSLRMPTSPVQRQTPQTATNNGLFQRYSSLRIPQRPVGVVCQQASTVANGPFKGVSAIWEGDEDVLSDLTANFARPVLGSNLYCGTKAFSFDCNFSTENNGFGASANDLNKTVDYNLNEPTFSTSSLNAPRSKGDQWLESAANQAKLLQQQRETPPFYSAAPASPPCVENGDETHSLVLSGTTNRPNSGSQCSHAISTHFNGQSAFHNEAHNFYYTEDTCDNGRLMESRDHAHFSDRSTASKYDEDGAMLKCARDISATLSIHRPHIFEALDDASASLDQIRPALKNGPSPPPNADDFMRVDGGPLGPLGRTALQSTSFDDKWASLANPFRQRSSGVDV